MSIMRKRSSEEGLGDSPLLKIESILFSFHTFHKKKINQMLLQSEIPIEIFLASLKQSGSNGYGIGYEFLHFHFHLEQDQFLPRREHCTETICKF